jgi:hypothetical protein
MTAAASLNALETRNAIGARHSRLGAERRAAPRKAHFLVTFGDKVMVDRARTASYVASCSPASAWGVKETIMRQSIGTFALLVALGLTACGSGDDNGNGNQAGASSGAASGKAGATSSGGSDSAGGKNNSVGGEPPMTLPGSMPVAMPLISQGVPAFASSASPDGAKDWNQATSWVSTAVPAWLAYDLSGVEEAKRSRVLLAWYDGATLDFINAAPNPDQHLPVDFKLETNSAAGGGPAPADGWETVETVTGNDRNAHQRLVDLNGASWVRVSVSKSSSPSAVGLDFDVHSAPDGATDSWLFMGDSITFMSTSYLFSDLPARVHELKAERWPAVIPAAIGGTNTMTAMMAIDSTMANFPGRFVVLAYGTNDHPAEYQMEALVQKVIAAGKVPVVPHMPWATDARIQDEGPKINDMIDALYAKYPEILHGPDFWGVLKDRTDLIPSNDIHPNELGQKEFRKQWALAMTQ